MCRSPDGDNKETQRNAKNDKAKLRRQITGMNNFSCLFRTFIFINTILFKTNLHGKLKSQMISQLHINISSVGCQFISLDPNNTPSIFKWMDLRVKHSFYGKP